MAFFGIFFGILCVIGMVVLTVMKSKHKSGLAQLRAKAKHKGYSEDEIEAAVSADEFPVPGFAGKGLLLGAVLFTSLGMFNNLFFYAEPGYIYHVRTLFPAQERVIDSVGYS